jgi:hypothetical protein
LRKVASVRLTRGSNCTITGNQGGGIYNNAENSGGALLEINNSSVTDNSGGGIYNDALGGGVATLNITDGSVNNNYSGGAKFSVLATNPAAAYLFLVRSLKIISFT